MNISTVLVAGEIVLESKPLTLIRVSNASCASPHVP